MAEGPAPRGRAASGRVGPRPADIHVRLFAAVRRGDNQLADHALMRVEEDMAVEQPAPEGAAHGDTVRKRPVFEMHAEIQCVAARDRSEEHTSELQSLMRISYAVFCLKKKK